LANNADQQTNYKGGYCQLDRKVNGIFVYDVSNDLGSFLKRKEELFAHGC